MPNKIHDGEFVTGQCITTGAPVVIDDKNKLHVVWYKGKGDLPKLYYTTSSDDGKTFDNPLPLLTSKWVSPTISAIALDNKNIVWVVWEHIKEQQEQRQSTNFYFQQVICLY